MPITETKAWDEWVTKNDDPYGKACVDVARRVMELLDENEGAIDCHALICQADKEIDAGGITGFMAGCVAQMVSKCHSRGEEFRRQWNSDHGITEDKDKGGVVNPAVLTIAT